MVFRLGFLQKMLIYLAVFCSIIFMSEITLLHKNEEKLQIRLIEVSQMLPNMSKIYEKVIFAQMT